MAFYSLRTLVLPKRHFFHLFPAFKKSISRSRGSWARKFGLQLTGHWFSPSSSCGQLCLTSHTHTHTQTHMSGYQGQGASRWTGDQRWLVRYLGWVWGGFFALGGNKGSKAQVLPGLLHPRRFPITVPRKHHRPDSPARL